MKEWIYKDGSGKYVLTTDPEVANLAADAVEVPCGANKLTKCGLCLYFWNTVNNTTYVDGTGWQPCDNDSLCTFESYIMDSDVHVIWQRHPNQETIDAMNDDKTEEFETKEMVNHPEHYNKHPSGIECIDIARHHDFAIGSAIKYLWRAGLKESDNEIQDLKKAVFYIQDKIKQLESKNVDDKTFDWIENLEKNP